MSFTSYFSRLRQTLGALYSVADPTLVDGSPSALRVNEKAHLMVDVANSSSTGYLLTRSGWEPMDGLSQRVSIGAAAARSTALTVGAEYHISSTVDCWIVAGAVTVNAVVGEDYKLLAGIVFPYVVETSKDYISVIRDAVDGTNGLAICRVL